MSWRPSSGWHPTSCPLRCLFAVPPSTRPLARRTWCARARRRRYTTPLSRLPYCPAGYCRSIEQWGEQKQKQKTKVGLEIGPRETDNVHTAGKTRHFKRHLRLIFGSSESEIQFLIWLDIKLQLFHREFSITFVDVEVFLSPCDTSQVFSTLGPRTVVRRVSEGQRR